MRRVVSRTVSVAVIALATACGGVSSGTIGQACMAAGREAATPQLCSCIQRVADQSLSDSDQNRAAKFFANPDEAQRVRQSDGRAEEQFWERYRAFADRAAASCG